jgi:ArsR family transcriptional regulator
MCYYNNNKKGVFTMSEYQRKVHYLKALSSPVRLRIIEFLQSGPKMSEQIKNEFNLHPSVVQQNLSKMVVNGIIQGVRNGRYVRYEITDLNVVKILKLLP